MCSKTNTWLLIGAAFSALAALLHVAVIVGGPDSYRFFGAGEDMARVAAAGSPVPALVTPAIATMLAIWALCALSGAAHIRRLPLLRTALSAITASYLLRGLALVPALAVPALRKPFNVWSSVIRLGFGLVHPVGLVQVWTRLGSTAAPRGAR